MFWTRAILWKIIKVLEYLIGMVRYFPARKKNYFFIPYLTRPHTLRHTFGSTLIRRGVGIEVISKLMGHANITITYNKYIHTIKEEAKTMDMIRVC